MARQSFDQEINDILKKAEQQFGKHLRFHSFRATMITEVLVTTPIDLVKEFIGHNDIKSTLTYKSPNEANTKSDTTNSKTIRQNTSTEQTPV